MGVDRFYVDIVPVALMAMTSSTYIIDAIWNMYQVIDQGGLASGPFVSEAIPAPWGDNGLTGLREPCHATISCGMHYGPVRVTVEEYDSSVDPPELAKWTDIVELPFQVVSGEVTFADWNGEPFHTATTVAPGEYRLRVHARGRDEAQARTYELTMDDEPVEEHLIQLFPGSGAQVVHKTEDRFGQHRRGSAEPVPLPRGRDRMPEAEFEEFGRSRDVILGLTAKMSPQGQRLMIELLTEQADQALRELHKGPQAPTEQEQQPPPPSPEDLRTTLEAVMAQAMAAMPPEMRALMGDPDNPTLANMHVPVGDLPETLRRSLGLPAAEAPETPAPQEPIS